MTALEISLLVFFPALMAFAASSDLLTMTIPNRVSLLLVAGFLGFAGILGLPWTTIGWHLLAGLLVLACTFGMFAAGWIGGGDAKLAAATAIWCGFGSLLEYSLVASVLGGLLTLFILHARTHVLPSFAQGWPWLIRLHDSKTGIPYGIALAAAGLVVLPHTTIFKAGFGVL
ncbi:MAG TPA: prepilin peptidase [Accumulibacter sp.]|nr:prepilin peptidase [Accumulibacter sp.]